MIFVNLANRPLLAALLKHSKLNVLVIEFYIKSITLTERMFFPILPSSEFLSQLNVVTAACGEDRQEDRRMDRHTGDRQTDKVTGDAGSLLQDGVTVFCFLMKVRSVALSEIALRVPFHLPLTLCRITTC